MSSTLVTNPEPLTLLTTPAVEMVYDREEILREREIGNLARCRVDRYIAKVLPPGSVLRVEPATYGTVRVLDCAYRPFSRKELFALEDLVEAAPPGTPDAWTRPAPPPPEEIRRRLLAREGTRYLFGGSTREGSPRQAAVLVGRGLFPESDRDDPDLGRILSSSGLDCSGLFNHATDYAFFGDSKDVYRAWSRGLATFEPGTGDDPESLAAGLQPLDVILYRGHMMVALGGGRLIQAVGDGPNAQSFAIETGYPGPAWEKYDRVVIDDAVPILRALILRQGRRRSSTWRLDDRHFMVVRRPPPLRRLGEDRGWRK
jgi:hypothetical protein